MKLKSKRVLRHRLVGFFLVLTMLLSMLPVANVEAATTYDYAKVESIAKSSDVESVFNNYVNFIGKYINDVGDMEVFMFAVKDPIAVLKSIVTGDNPQESAVSFMNDPEHVKPILRDAIGEITSNRNLKAFPDDGKVIMKAFEKYCKLYGKLGEYKDKIDNYKDYSDAGSDYTDAATVMGDLGKIFDTAENIDKVTKDYTENMIMLDSIKDLFPSGSASWKMIDQLQKDYSHSLFSTIRDWVVNKVKKTAIGAIDPLGIYSIIQLGLKNNGSVKALDYVIYSNTLQCEAIRAYKKAAAKIKSGNYTDDDMVAYINEFELCRALTEKSYEKMRGRYSQNSNEYKYLTEQIANLKKMSCEKPIKAILYSDWLAAKSNGRTAEYPINVIAMPATTYYAVKDNVPVRAKPYAADTILKNLNKGTAVTVVGTGINSAGNLWCKLNDGNWIFSDNLSITNPLSTGTTPAAPTPATTTKPPASASPALVVLDTTEDSYKVTIPANYKLDCYQTPTSKTLYTWMSAKTTSYSLYCTKRLTMSDGTTRYFFISGEGKQCYFVFTNSMSVANSSTGPTSTQVPTPAPSTSKQLITNGVYRITTQLDKRYCLAVSDSKANSGLALTNNYAFPYAGFRVTHLGDNYYRIECDYYNMALTSNASGTDAYVYPNGGIDVQMWKIQPVGNGSYQIINKQNGQFLDVANAYAANGTKVGLFVQNDGYDAQKWIFTAISSTGSTPTTTPASTPEPTVMPTPTPSTVTLTRIDITPPNLTTYYIDEDLSLVGIVVTATYSDNSKRNVTSLCKISGFDSSTLGARTITVSYTEYGTTRSAQFPVSIVSRPTTKPSVTVDSITNITSTSVRIAFTVYNPSGLMMSNFGVRLGISSGNGMNFTMGKLNKSDRTISSAVTINGLDSNTKFYFRVFVENGGIAYYSDEISFTTLH